MTVCSTSDHKEKDVRKNTVCSWYKFSEFNSLESSDPVQRNEGDQGDPGRQPDSRRKCVAGTVAHQSVLIAPVVEDCAIVVVCVLANGAVSQSPLRRSMLPGVCMNTWAALFCARCV